MEKLARKRVRELTPYLSARRIGGNGDIWLNANESPFNNEYSITLSHLNRYSDCQPEELINAYASYAGVKPEQTLTSRGADESIELLIRAYCEPGEDAIIYCPPTYGMYSACAQCIGVERKAVALKEDWSLDLDSIEKNIDNVKLVFVCSPNNPTGHLVNRDDLISLLGLTKDRAVVVLDEAYIDFSAQASMEDLLDKYQNLAILRTLSKAFALAGLRCGFTIANKSLIDVLLKVISPYPVPIPVVEIAVQALSEMGILRMKEQIAILNRNRDYLKEKLSHLENVTVFNGWGNYILVKFSDGDSVFKSAWDNGIILRNTPIDNCVRISVGDHEECKKTVEFIYKFIQKC
jgi:histidinol-phosphate aminotransferase